METTSYLASSDFDIAFDEPTLSEYELERGKPMPSVPHAIAQENLMDALASYKHQYRRLPEISLRLGGEKYVPDIALYERDAVDWHEPLMELHIPPLLAIEIVSPSQSMDEMKAKADKYFVAGIRSVWLVLPALAGIMVLHAGKKARFYSEGTILDDELGIELPIDAVFE